MPRKTQQAALDWMSDPGPLSHFVIKPLIQNDGGPRTPAAAQEQHRRNQLQHAICLSRSECEALSELGRGAQAQPNKDSGKK